MKRYRMEIHFVSKEHYFRFYPESKHWYKIFKIKLFNVFTLGGINKRLWIFTIFGSIYIDFYTED